MNARSTEQQGNSFFRTASRKEHSPTDTLILVYGDSFQNSNLQNCENTLVLFYDTVCGLIVCYGSQGKLIWLHIIGFTCEKGFTVLVFHWALKGLGVQWRKTVVCELNSRYFKYGPFWTALVETAHFLEMWTVTSGCTRDLLSQHQHFNKILK